MDYLSSSSSLESWDMNIHHKDLGSVMDIWDMEYDQDYGYMNNDYVHQSLGVITMNNTLRIMDYHSFKFKGSMKYEVNLDENLGSVI